MEAIKIGPAEEKLISEIEEFKEKYKDRLLHMEEGLEIAIKQLPADAKGELKSVQEKIDNAKRLVNRLRIIIETIAFSKDDNGETFSVTWREFGETAQQYYQHIYGSGTNVLTEKKLVHAITSWENEVRRAQIMFKQIAGYSFNTFCSKMDQHIHKIVDEYVDPKTT